MPAPLEIERKWIVDGWPYEELPLLKNEFMQQGYISTRPSVRIREEASTTETHYILNFKSHGQLTRKEVEIEISKEKFEELEDLIGLPMIVKIRRTFQLPDGNHLEVNHVDEGLPTEFWYAEIEYKSEEDARSWDPASVGLAGYLRNDVTDEPGQSMAAYWRKTRENKE